MKIVMRAAVLSPWQRSEWHFDQHCQHLKLNKEFCERCEKLQQLLESIASLQAPVLIHV